MVKSKIIGLEESRAQAERVLKRKVSDVEATHLMQSSSVYDDPSPAPYATHSLGVRESYQRGYMARRLLENGTKSPPRVEAGELREDFGKFPLIDLVHAASFTDHVGLQWVEDKFMLRERLKKAHRFVLDDTTSELMAEFSVAIVEDLDAARRLAVPPFPVCWFDIDNHAFLRRMQKFTKLIGGAVDPDQAVRRKGWLITPHYKFDHCLTYFAEINQGVFTAPLSFCWNVGDTSEGYVYAETSLELSNGFTFGITGTPINPADASVYPASFAKSVDEIVRIDHMPANEIELLREVAGELRHAWGLFIALGAGHLGAEVSTGEAKKSEAPKVFAKGKELFPLEHKTLTIKLAKRKTVKVIAAQAIFHARKRWHEVRAHWRELKNEDGSVRKRVSVKSHARGDKHLGVIDKTYKVER